MISIGQPFTAAHVPQNLLAPWVYIHAYIVIDTHDTYRKILLIIANTILNRRKNTEKLHEYQYDIR